MSMPIRTQTFQVTVSASIMPPMTEVELHDVVLRLAFEKESRRGMGALGVDVQELSNTEQWED